MAESSFPDKLFAGQRGFPTPNEAPDARTCRVLSIPAGEEWLALAMGALDALRQPYNWYINGTLTQEEAAAAFADILDTAYEQALTGQCAPDVEAPFWDTDTDVGANAPVGEQTWYGEVDDPAAVPTELTFRENLEIWTFAGLLAIAAAPGAAISFITIAPRFTLAFKQANIGKIIRVFIDASEAASFTDDGSETIREVSIVGDPANETHQMYITVGGA